MLISRVPGAALRPFVRVLWATTGDVPGERPPRERVLPTGGTHLVFLLAWGELAFSLGYADQAHFNREFRQYAGVTPGAYRRAAPRLPHHLPLPSAT